MRAHRIGVVVALLLFLTKTAAASSPWAASAGDDYVVTPNVTYRTVSGWQGKLDIYTRAESSTSPTLVWFHGGGWTRGSKEAELLYVLPYLERGWSVVNVEYRLAATAPAPAAVEDGRCALLWIVANADTFDLNVDKLVVSGISAGGHLALMSVFLPATSRLAAPCPGDAASHVAAVVNWFGPADLEELLVAPHRFEQAVEWFGDPGKAEELAAEVSPLSHVRAALPPVITIHGKNDDLIPHRQSVRLHAALRTAGVPNELVTIEHAKHGFFGASATQRAYRKIWSFLEQQGVATRP